MKTKIVIATTLLSIFSSATFALNTAGDTTFSLGGGYTNFISKRKIQNTNTRYASLAYNFNDQWGVVGSFESFNTHFSRSVNDERSITGTRVAVDAIYRFYSANNFQPYLLAGPGITGLNPNLSDSNNEGNFNVGVGTQYFIHKGIAFFAEGRDYYTLVGGKNDLAFNFGISILLNKIF